ncbi:right-handed parallel beta-helix repeat-containing protein [Blastococcus sp. TML/M2B]|uniref:right-handed parallel beta-helix repeat-containing protein n=1 Tax=Blastococcus sp. TML/M2B TaxID=2798727 RepID=UPI0019090B5D|nr:right-handed parallel beta-helix repeat-containing protein [Blastococcus sp. TML/M2B]MBN1091301.1 right-handed parallel beta-helix repeat-containing protein [Blastococcus sp. TML/M2B]
MSVASYGARADGRTDAAPAIRAALAANQHVHIPAGEYLLETFESPRQTRLHADFMFSLRSGQTVTADPGAVLTFADGIIPGSPTLWGGNLFMIDGASDVTISGGTWDFNGANNLVPAGRTITGYGVYTYGADRVTVRDVTMQNTPGQNYIVMQGRGDGFRVEGSTFVNGGTSLAANREQVDYSAMYFTGSNVVVDRVRITHDRLPWFYSGGIELHGTRNAVTNSVIERSFPAVYIGPDVASELEVMEDTVVTGNQFLEVGRAVTFHALGTGAIAGVEFARNTVTMTSFPGLGAGRGVDQDAPPDGNWTYHHIITGLDIRDNDFHDADGQSDFGIRLSQIHSGTIQQNRFHQMSGTVFQLGGSPWDTRNVTFSDNSATWLGSTGAPAIALGLDGYRADGIVVTRNRITRTQAEGSACGVYSDGVITSSSVTGNGFAGIGLPMCGPTMGSLAFAP